MNKNDIREKGLSACLAGHKIAESALDPTIADEAKFFTRHEVSNDIGFIPSDLIDRYEFYFVEDMVLCDIIAAHDYGLIQKNDHLIDYLDIDTFF